MKAVLLFLLIREDSYDADCGPTVIRSAGVTDLDNLLYLVIFYELIDHLIQFVQFSLCLEDLYGTRKCFYLHMT